MPAMDNVRGRDSLAGVLLLAGAFFAIMEVVYGYVFNVWSDAYAGLQHGATAMSRPTKLGEMMLFGFLALVCPLLSIAVTSLGRRTS